MHPSGALIPRSITARPFSLTEVVEEFSIGARIIARVMAFKMPKWHVSSARDYFFDCFIYRKSSGLRPKLGFMSV